VLRRWLERRRATRRRGPRARAEPLEPRILYSADLLAGALPDPPTPDAGAMVRDVGPDAAASAHATAAADPRALELVVVDAGVPDAQRLVDAIAAQRPDASLRIVLLDATRDGLAQIGEALTSMSGVSAVHLLAHGEPGAVVLSGRMIDAAAVDAVGTGLAAWREALAAEADLLVYGCDLAASDAGIDLMARLARWTGADVAASDDTTGSADAGGDWTLEAATGAIEARTVFAGAEPAGWSGRLELVSAGSDATAHTTTTGVQTAIYAQRAVAVAADGSSLVVWHDDAGAGDVYAQRYDASGAAVGSAFRVNTTTADAQSTPEVAVGGDGHWWVVWASVDQDAVGTSGIYAQRYAADGSALGGEFQVNTTTAGDQSLPSIAVDASGDAVIVWQHGAGTPEDIRGQRFDATGTAQGAEFTVNTVASTDPMHAKVAMDATGRFVVTWQNTNQDGAGAGIFARLYNAAGTALGTEFQVNQTTAGDQVLPDVAMNADGFVVAWMSDDGGGWGISARRFDATGTAVDDAFLVNTTTTADQRNPQIAMTAGGGFVVTWESDGQDGDQMGVYLRQFAADDVALTGETRVNVTTAGYQAQASVAVNAAGDLVVAYTGNQGGTDDVWVRRWTLSEERVVTVTTTADTVDGTTTSVAALLAAPGGDGAVSLREAILAANATGGAQTIRFAIPLSDPNYAGGVYTITLASLLPQLTGAVTLDGTTQTTAIGDTNPGLLGTGGTVGVDALALGQVARPEIEIVDGGSVSVGLDLAAAGITVRGLAMQGFDVAVLRLRSTASNALIEGNVLGSGATAFVDPGSGARSDTIVESMGADGGTLRNNLIGFADETAVELDPGSDRWTVTGNEVRGGSLGSDILNALDLQGDDAVIRGNLFADSRGSGIDLRGTTSDALFQNNTVSNIGYGVSAEGHSLAIYGSATATIDRNVIRDAPQNAIRVAGTAQAVISRNEIDGSGGLGIELGYDGVSSNDALDTDLGPNGLQNHPVLLTADTDGVDARITGTLSSAASTTYRLEFFSSPVADASGHGEGRTYLGTLDVTTDASGEASFSTTLSGVGLAGGHAVTATATRMAGATAVETSEFAASVVATAAPVIVTSGGSLAYTEGDGAAAIDTGLTVTDIDSATLAGATVRISVNFTSGQDVLAFVDQNGITGSWNAGTGTLTLSGTATRAQYEAALRTVTYRNTSDAPSTATRSISFVANDGALDSAAVVRTVTVAPEADAPTDIDLASAAGTNLLVNGSFEDNPGAPGAADYPMSLPGWTSVGTDPLEVWNSYDQGGPGTASDGQALLEIDSFGGLNGIAQTVTTTAGQTYVLSFDLSNRTPSAVAGLEVYWRGELVATVTQSVVAWRTHAFVVTGSGGADELRFVETAATNDSVGPLLDDVRLVAARTPAISVAEGAANGTEVAIAGRADLDAASDATVSWSLVDDAGGRFAIDAASGRITVALGSALDHEAAASHSIIVRVEDASGLSRQESFTIAVGDVEEATVNTLPTDRYTPVDTPLVFGTAGGNAIGVTDGDTGPLRITLTVDAGTLTLASVTGLAFAAGDGTADATMTFTGTQAEVAAALDGLAFTPTGGFRGLATITVTSEDAGGTSTDTDTVRVHVGAIVVTTTSDLSNGNTSSFAALAASNGGDGVSLREAIELTNAVANATGQVDHIRFAIAAPLVGGVHTIAVASALPGITDAVDLDASSEPDFAGTPVVELDGTATASAPDNTGIRLLGGSSGSTIRGLVINRFGDDGLLISDSSDNAIVGNVIGTDAAGTVDLGNEQDGVLIGGTSTNNTIGGTAAADRNRIAGNDLVGVRLTGAAVTGNRVLGNTIGIDGGGTTIGQGADGVVIQAGAWGNTIGGAAAGSGNTIAASGGAGILVAADAGAGNALLRNVIGTSTGLGIDLGGDGVTANDALDADTGPNDLQNAPVLLDAATTGTEVRLRGSLDAAASTEYRLEFHAIAAGAEDASGHGEGGVFLVAVTVTTDAAGRADFDFTTAASVAAADRVTATATVSLGGGAFGSTSEFAQNVVATGVPTLTASAGPLAWAEGDGAVAIDPGLVVADADSATLAGASVVIATNYANGEDVLAFSDQAGITGSWNAATGTLTLTGAATLAQYQAALRSITYANTSDAPSTLQRVVSFTVTDGTSTSAAATRAIDVTAVNDAPAVTASGTPLAYTENDGAVAVDPGLVVAEADNATLAGATVTIVTNHASGEDVLGFTDQAGITGSWNGATGTLTLSGTATVAQYQAALRSITYTNTSDAPSTLQRVVSFTVDDGTSTSTAATRAIDLTAVNDAPTVTPTGTPLAYTENDGAVAVDPGLVIADADNATLTGATVTIVTNHASGEDVLAFSDQAGITGSWNAATGTLTLTGTATVAQYQAALRSITYTNSSDAPSTLQRVVSFIVDDGTTTSTAATRAVDVAAVGDAPTVTASSGALAYTENAGAVAVDAGLVVADADSATLAGATVVIATNYTNGEDVLAFTDQTGITGSWNAATGTLTLTGTATVAQYQAALRSVTYTNSSDAPSTLQRVVSFTVEDGTTTSAAATRAIDLTAVNDAPTVTASGTPLAYTENDGAVAVDPGLVLDDLDHTTLAGATVRIVTNHASGEDLLAFTDQAGITGSWNAATGTLTLSGTATVAQYQAALRSITYTNTSDAPSTLQWVVSFTVDDGTSTSTAATRAIDLTAVNDAPTVTASGTPLAYSENAGAIAVDPGLVVADADNATLVGATVTIVTNHASGEDVLAFTDQAGITGSWNAATGTLTLTGTATLAQYQAALRSITYANSSDAPSALQRVVSFTVDDGTTTSAAATRAIDVIASNDAPTVTASGTPLAYTENDGAVAVDPGLVLDDLDDATLTGATVRIATHYANGEDVLSFTDQSGITGSWNSATGTLTLTGTATVAQYEAALRSINYTNTSDAPSTLQRIVSFTVADGTSTSAAATGAIDVTAVNEAPTVTASGTPLAYTENDGAIAVDPGLVVADVDTTTLVGATVTIVTNHASGEDVLAFTNQAGITGSWNGDTGTLTLTGTATVAQYQAALRSITYTNTSDAPSMLQRVVAFTVTDGTATSATATRAIDLIAVNDAPTVTASGTPLAYTENAGAIAVDPGLGLADADGTTIAGATVTIVANHEPGEDVLAFTNQAGITGSWNAATGTLTLTGTATLAQYQAALRTVTYTNTSDAPSTLARTIEFVVDDGTATSAAASRTVTVADANDPPGVTTTSGALAYAADTSADAIDPGLVVTDVDSATLAGATIRITTNYANGEDVLGFTDQAGITGSWNAATGTLTLTGTASIAQYEAALRSVTYANVSSTPSTAQRVVSFTVDDGTATSAAATRAIDVNLVNRAPAFAGLDATVRHIPGMAPVVMDADVTVADVELDALGAWTGATLTLQREGGASADDAFSATGRLSALTAGGPLTLGGTTIGTVSTNAGGTLVLTFGAAATPAAVQETLRSLAYAYVGAMPAPDEARIAWTIDDGNTGAQGPGGARQGTGVSVVALTGVPGITVTPPASTTTAETGTSVTFSVVLDARPLDTVTISVSIGNPLEGRVSTTVLVFGPGDWNVAQQVVVTGVDDTVVDGTRTHAIVFGPAISTDAGYSGLDPGDFTITNVDDDVVNTIAVTTDSDIVDGTVTSLAALWANRGADGEVSLREAILAANAGADGPGGIDRIVFDIAGTDEHVIALASALPTIDRAVSIDASTDDSFAAAGGAPAVRLDGDGTVDDGLRLGVGADGSTVRGLVFTGFVDAGIEIAGSGGHVIAGNAIGPGAGGAGSGNAIGISVTASSGTRIGGTAAGDGNSVSGNDVGLRLGAGATGTLVLGNRIGADATGTTGAGNGSTGVLIVGGASNNTIGGRTAGAANVIAANGGDGIVLSDAGTSGNRIEGNRIGELADGSIAEGNVSAGVRIDSGATGNTIGGTAAGAGNRIAANGAAGVVLTADAGTGNAILGNVIRANIGPGIDLGDDGTTSNDALDADSGANALQNFPVPTLARTDGAGTVSIAFDFESSPNRYYRVEFFSVSALDADGHGEGARYLGHVDVLTDASGRASASATLSATVAVGEFVTATATRTDASGTTMLETSEFSRGIAAIDAAQATVVVTNTSDVVDGDVTSLSTLLADRGADGSISLREALLAANATANGSLGADRIRFDLPGSGPATIVLATDLPAITNAIVIDGTSDPDWSGPGGPPVVIIDGAESAAVGLDLRDGADGSTIRGLLIRNVLNAGIEIRSGSDGHLIAGNRIGAFDAAGQPIATAQASYGILVYGANVTVGGVAAGDGNLIAGAGESAVVVWGAGASGAVVIGNRIGVAADGITSIGNATYGVRVAAGASGVRIGGTAAGEGNIIVASGSAGVLVDGGGGGSTATILGNRFVESGSLDIDLSAAAYADGPTANDVGDADSGGNGLLNAPVLVTAVRNGTTVEITGTLDAAPSTTYRIEVFTSPVGEGNVSGYGASSLLTALEVTTDASGHAVIAVSIAAPSVADGDDIAATATVKLGAGWGATSEFATNVQVEPYTAPPTLAGGGGTPTYVENAAAVALDPGLVVTDLDSPTLSGATVTIVANYDAARDRLVFVDQAGISGGWDAVSGTLYLWGDASVADWQAALRSVAFEHVGENPSGAARTIVFVVQDAEGGNESVPLSVPLAVTPVADPPSTSATFALSRTNTPSLPVVLRGTDVDDAVVAFRLTSLPAYGLLYVDAGHLTLAAVGVDYAAAGQSVTLHFVPATEWVGTTTFDFVAVDASGLADPSPATATITIGDDVDPPVAVADAFAVDEDSDLAVDADGVLANDVATGGRTLVATLVAGPASAAVFALDADGSFVYRPRADFNGTDTFTYLASDGVGDTNVVTVTLTVNAVNDSPTLADAVLPAVAEDVTAPTGSTVAALLGAGFSDPDAGAFLAGVLVIYDDQYGDPSAGVWQYSTDGGASWHEVGPVAPEDALALDATARLRFLPAPDWNGAPEPLYVLALDDTWTGGFTAGAVRVAVDASTLPENGASSFDWATVSTQVTAVNDAPVILSNGGVPVASLTVDEGNPVASTLDAQDIDVPAQQLTWSIVGGEDAARFEIDAALGLLRFLQVPDFERPDDVGGDHVYTVVLELSDGIAAVRQSITVTVTDLAETPTVTAPARVLATEDVPLTIAGLAIVDGDGDITRLDIGVDAGTLDARLDGGALVVGGALGSRSLTLAGTEAQLGAALATLGYRGAADYAGNDRLRIVATDATGLSSGIDVEVAVAPVNDAPTLLRNLGIEVAEGASVTLADSRLSFADVDDSPGAVLIRLDTAPVSGELRVGGTVLGAGGLFSQADLLAGRVVYRHLVAGTTADTLVLSAADDDGLRTSPIAVSITIDAVNDPPRWVAPTAVITFEDTTVVFDDASNRRILAIDDADRNALLELRLQVGPGATLSLARLDGLTMISAGDGAGAPIVFRATLFDANRALAGLRLDPVSNFTGTTTLTLTIDDLGATGTGGPQSTTTTVSVTVAPVNDAPTLIVPGAQTVTEDTPLRFGTSGTARILIADSDAVGLLTLSLAVDAGTLTLGSAEGLAFLAGDGTDDSVIVVRGTVARLQAAVDGLRFTPATDFAGSAALDLIADDGQGGTVQRRVAIEVTPVDDPAGALAPGAQQVRSDGTLGFGLATGNAIQVRDVDGAPGGVSVELQVGRGALRVDAVAGVTLAPARDGGAGMRLRLDGSLDAVNRALATLVYQPVADWWGAVELRVVVLGGDGSTPVSTKSVTIGVLPLATGPSTAGTPVAPGAAAGAPVAAPTAADPGAATRGASSSTAVGDVLAPRTLGTRTAIASNTASVQPRAAGTSSAEASALLDANADAGATGVVPRTTAFATMAGRAVEGGGSGGTAASASATAADAAWLLISADRIALLPTPTSVDPTGLREVLDAGLAPAQAVRGERGATDVPALEVSLVQGAQVVGVALTAGTLWWAIYGGTTLWILLATGPLARTFDPLPVLMRDDNDGPRDAADAMFEEGEDEPDPDDGTPRGRRDAKAVAVPA
jgi:CSLREA domain-containing protein